MIGAIALILSSGLPVRFAINYIEGSSDRDVPDELLRAGRVIGKCENILVLVFVLTGSYTALAVVFAAEGIITRKVENDFYPIYVLSGTLINFTYSILVSMAILFIISW
jgi:hypothetical protein